MKGIIYDVRRFAIGDGPGIRTTVYLKGCSLRCAWCSRPESIQPYPEILYDPVPCADCGKCEEVCPNKSARATLGARAGQHDGESPCIRCLGCAQVCRSGAITSIGREVSAEEIVAELEEDRTFFDESGGGLTLSGGEPMLQLDFTRELLALAHSRRIHTCIKTSGHAAWDHFVAIRPLVDLFIWDLLDHDQERHQRLTGAPLQPILANLQHLDRIGAKTILRCVLISGLNLTAAHLNFIVSLCRRLRNVQGVMLLPYHPPESSSHSRLGVPRPADAFQTPSPLQIDTARAWLDKVGVTCIRP